MLWIILTVVTLLLAVVAFRLNRLYARRANSRQLYDFNAGYRCGKDETKAQAAIAVYLALIATMWLNVIIFVALGVRG